MTHRGARWPRGELLIMATAEVVGVSDLLASAFSSTLGSTVVTYDHYEKEQTKPKRERQSYFQALSIDQLFSVAQLSGRFGDKPRDGAKIQLYVKTLTGKILSIEVDNNDLVEDVKERIQCVEGIPPYQQRILFAGQLLDASRAIADYGISTESTLYLVLRLRAGGCPQYYINDSLLDPRYDYDFTRMRDDGTKYYRGGYEYHRPYGWKRYAIKVRGRFDDDRWLGARGLRADSSDGEWPVSYHGTAVNVSGNIAQEGYDLSKGKIFLYGKGVYCTPSIEVAAMYICPEV